MIDDLRLCLANDDFIGAFVGVLGWEQFPHRSRVEVPNIGQGARGWPTREALAKLEAAPRIFFDVQGVAKLAGQVVLLCSPETHDDLEEVAIERFIRHLTMHFDRPMVILKANAQASPEWIFSVRNHDLVSIIKFSPETTRLATGLARLKITANNLGNDKGVRSKKVALFIAELDKQPDRDECVLYALRFAALGLQVCKAAKVACRLRVYDRPLQFEIARRAKAGDPDAIQRFFDMHRYLVFDRALANVGTAHPRVLDFEDFVGAGNLGIARALARYDPTSNKPPATVVYFNVQNQISHAIRLVDAPTRLAESIESDSSGINHFGNLTLAGRVERPRREAASNEAIASTWVDGNQSEPYHEPDPLSFESQELSWENLDDEDLEDSLIYREAFDRPTDLRTLEAHMRLATLAPRSRKALKLRVGLDPKSDGEPVTLLEVGETLGITKERVRQLVLHAGDNARHATIPPVDAPYGRQKGNGPNANFPNPRKGVSSASRYIDQLLNLFGLEANPHEVYRGMLKHFPFSTLTVERIARKIEVRRQHQAQDEMDRKIRRVRRAAREFALKQAKPAGKKPKGIDPEKPQCPPLPAPPLPFRRANSYIEYILDTYGSLYCPRCVYQAVKLFFPMSKLNEERIWAKGMKREFGDWNYCQP